MSWLVRMEIDVAVARGEGITDSYSWHKKLWECFPGMADKNRVEIGFLSRIDSLDRAFRLWVMAKTKPKRPPWCALDAFTVKEIATSFLSHQYYAFDLMANPVKTIVQRGPNGETLCRPDGKRKSGKRVPLVKPDELRAWLIKKGQVRCRDQSMGREVPGGFLIVEDRPLEIRPMVESYFRKKNRAKGKDQAAFHGGVQFRGTLEVTDQKRFAETYYSGIGSAKGFGFGLLLLAPVNL